MGDGVGRDSLDLRTEVQGAWGGGGGQGLPQRSNTPISSAENRGNFGLVGTGHLARSPSSIPPAPTPSCSSKEVQVGLGRILRGSWGTTRASACRPGHIRFPSRVPFPSLPPPPRFPPKGPLAEISSLSPDRGFSIGVPLGLRLQTGGQGLLAPLGLPTCAVPRLPWALSSANRPGPGFGTS